MLPVLTGDDANTLTGGSSDPVEAGVRGEDQLMTERPASPAAEAAGGPAPHYLPAMGRRWLLPLYDPFTRLLGVRRIHAQLLDRADVRPGSRVLEIGCGTGNLLLLAKHRCPAADVVGLDPDPDAVRRVRRKAARAGAQVQVDLGYAADLPYRDGSLDRVLSAFMLHHVNPAEIPQVLAEIRRVLRPGGSLHVVDIVGGHPARGPLRWLTRRSQRLAHSSPDPDRLVALLSAAGFSDAARTGQGSTRMGGYAFYRATA